MPKLKILQLSHNQLSVIRDDLTENTPELKFLDLSYNDLNTLPKSIRNNKDLRILYIGNNPGARMSYSWFGDLPLLQDLSLEGLWLGHIPPSICRLANLEILNLKSCFIHEIPVFIENLKNLKYLDVSFNNIRSFPYQLLKLRNLKEIVISPIHAKCKGPTSTCRSVKNQNGPAYMKNLKIYE